MKNLITLCCAVSLLMCIGLGCRRLGLIPDGETYFEDGGAQKAATAIREKIGKSFNVTEVFIDGGTNSEFTRKTRIIRKIWTNINMLPVLLPDRIR